MSYFNQHLRDVNESYFQHLGMAVKFAGIMAIGAIACFIHALFPFLCIKTGSTIVTRMHNDMVTHRNAAAFDAKTEDS